MSVCIIWGQLDGALVLTFSAGPVPVIIPFDGGEGVVRFCKRVIQFQSLDGCFAGLGTNLFRGKLPDPPLYKIGIGETGVGERISAGPFR